MNDKKSINIEWKQITIEDWVANPKCETFWIIKSQDNCVTGCFYGFDELSDEDADHFLDYRTCYYLKGKPCIRDKEGDCDCINEEKNSNCIINSLSIQTNIQNILYLRMNLLKKIKKLENKLLTKNDFMNGINFG